MIAKNKLVYLLIMIFTINVLLAAEVKSEINPSSTTLEWSISENIEYVWKVTQSNESYGYYPKDSKLNLKIDTISEPEASISQINGTIEALNSSSGLTDFIIDNEIFVEYNYSGNEVRLYQRFALIGFVLPNENYDEFIQAVFNFYEDHTKFNETGYDMEEGKLSKFWTYSEQREQQLIWEFLDGVLTARHTVKANDGSILFQSEIQLNDNGDDDDDELDGDLLFLVLILLAIGISAGVGVILIILKKKGVILS